MPNEADKNLHETTFEVKHGGEIVDTRNVIDIDRQSAEKRHSVSEKFEQTVTETLRIQDKILTKLEIKLESPVLNGGFDQLVKTVDKIEIALSNAVSNQKMTSEKLDLIHAGIYHPDDGLYSKVKDSSKWISQVNTSLKWFVALLATGMLSGVGKLCYDVIHGHLHYVP